MANIRKFTLLIAAIVLKLNLFSEGYNIKVKINGLHDTTIILGHHFNKSLYPDDTIRVNKKGEGIFKSDKNLPGGMYFIYLPNGRKMDILLSDNQKFDFEADTSTLIETMNVIGSLENQLFFDYQKFMIEKQDEAGKLSKQKENAQTEEEKERLTKEIDKIREEYENRFNEIVIGNSQTFFAKFLKATQEVEVPDPPKDQNGNIIDSAFQYKYYKAHYFDNFDISDARLLRTPIYEDKIVRYMDKVIPQVPDSIIVACDMLVDKARTTPELFRFMLVYLFNKYARSEIMGMDAVYIHLAEKYYIDEATWSDTAFINDLKERVIKTKPLLLGKAAPNSQFVHVPSELFELAKEDTALKNNPYVGSFFRVHDVKANYLVLFFWSIDCGHCKKTIPVLYDIFEKYKQYGFQVMSIHMPIDKAKWTDFINEHELYGWLNVWNPYSHQYKEDYDIQATNVIYMLDKDKKIIAKRIGAEQVEDILKHELKLK